MESQGNGQISIIPDSAVIVLKLVKNGGVSNQVMFYSAQPPPPFLEVKINGKAYSSFDKSASGPQPSTIKVTAVADEGFKSLVPLDANYQIAKWSLAVIRRSQIVGSFSFDNVVVTEAELSEFQSIVKSGDIIQIKLEDVKRINANRELINQVMPTNIMFYAIK